MKSFIIIVSLSVLGCARPSMQIATTHGGDAWVTARRGGGDELWRCRAAHDKPVCFKAEFIEDVEAWQKKVRAAHADLPTHGAGDLHGNPYHQREEKVMRWHGKGSEDIDVDVHAADGHKKIIIKRIDDKGDGEEEIIIIGDDGQKQVIKKKIKKDDKPSGPDAPAEGH